MRRLANLIAGDLIRDALDALSVGAAIAGTLYAVVLVVGLMSALGAPVP